MSLDKPKRVEEHILKILKNGPAKSVDLVQKIQEIRPKTTKQAVYSAIRFLKNQEQIITIKGIAYLNLVWLEQMNSFFTDARKNYIQKETQGSFLDLEDKEKINYFFRDAHKADVFWTHAYYLLLEQLPEGEPVFLYNPHEWFLIGRKENELDVIKTTTEKQHQFLLTAGSNTALDLLVAQFFDGTMSQYNILQKQMFEENNYYTNIFGDFIIEAWLNKNIANEIESIYQTASEIDECVQEKFKEILLMNGRMRIAISRNKKKAEKLKKALMKDFAINKKLHQ